MKKVVFFVGFLILVIISANDSGNYYFTKAKNNQSILLEREYIDYFEKNVEKNIIDGMEDLVIPEKEPTRLMIVAHPDDETIWGGAHLLKDKYTVVCITCGTVDYRTKEFERIMSITEDDYLMLGFPDVTNGHINSWDSIYNDIYSTLKGIIDSNEWDIVITHNPEGEYGHIHHQMTSNMVTDLANKNKLYYFGKYYLASDINNVTIPTVEDLLYDRKMNELIPTYLSQPLAMKSHHHMMNHENWLNYYEWY